MEAFKDVDVAMLVGAMPRREGMERKDLLAANVKIFKSMGNAIDQVANKNIKVSIIIIKPQYPKKTTKLALNVLSSTPHHEQGSNSQL
jgi:hypothetical protein